MYNSTTNHFSCCRTQPLRCVQSSGNLLDSMALRRQEKMVALDAWLSLSLASKIALLCVWQSRFSNQILLRCCQDSPMMLAWSSFWLLICKCNGWLPLNFTWVALGCSEALGRQFHWWRKECRSSGKYLKANLTGWCLLAKKLVHTLNNNKAAADL